jgi:hypothetical protein
VFRVMSDRNGTGRRGAIAASCPVDAIIA